MSTVYQNRHQYLRRLIDQYGNASSLADALGISRQQMSHISKEVNAKNIGDKQARRIEMKLGLPIGSMDASLTEVKEDSDAFSVEIPLLNVTASMGAGATIPWAEEVCHRMRVSKDWLRHNTSATSFSNLALITARGDSMSPTFESGDILLVDTSVTAMKQEAIYVLARGEDLFVKRINRKIDGTYDVISDNTKYGVQSINDPIKDGLLVMGKVLLAWGPRKNLS